MFSGQIDQELVYTLAALLPLVLQLGGLAFAAAVDAYFGKREKRIFLLILILVLCLIAQNYVDMLLCRGRAKDLARTISAIVGCCSLYYLWPHLQSARQVERQLQERQRMQIMLSQIKPHFLYNTLSTIEALCLTDPKAANRAAARLSEYLRGNLATISEDKPLHFQRQQTKELFAYLISRDGAACTHGEISAALWEEEGDMKLTGNRIRTLFSDLRGTLRSIGMEDVLIRHRASIALNRSLLDCNFYRMQSGDMDAINAFRGEFMVQYSWAEMTAGMLIFDF